MITMKELSQFIFSYIRSSGFDIKTTKISLLPGDTLNHVLQDGYFPLEASSINHSESLNIITAFTIESLLKDLENENDSIFKNYLTQYKNPFVVFYDGSDFNSIQAKNSAEFYFLPKQSNKNIYVLGLASVNVNNMMTGALTNLSESMSNFNMERFPRFYLTMTNFCNRSCPFCCCSSGPERKTFLSFEKFLEIISMEDKYEVQFEGGEPLVHPEFWKMLDHCLNDDKCKLIVLCTNSVLIPFQKNKMIEWLSRFNKKPFILKPSYNSYLVEKDKNLLDKLLLIKNVWHEIDWKPGSNLVINARRNQLTHDKEYWITEDLKRTGLISNANVFFYQKMGLAKDDEYIEPVIVQNNVKFYLIAPDGTNWATGLTERAKYMENMK